jgi:hypothetical protein
MLPEAPWIVRVWIDFSSPTAGGAPPHQRAARHELRRWAPCVCPLAGGRGLGPNLLREEEVAYEANERGLLVREVHYFL